MEAEAFAGGSGPAETANMMWHPRRVVRATRSGGGLQRTLVPCCGVVKSTQVGAHQLVMQEM